MTFHVFYDCYSRDEAVSSQAPLPCSLNRARRMLPEMLLDEGDFLGVVDPEGNVLQFMKVHQRIWMEVPSPEQGGSFGKHVTLEEAQAVFDTIDETIDPYFIDGLEFESWE